MENSIYTSSDPFDINLPNDISNDVIVIDTSVNRIGVNIIEPHYSIDVRDFSDASGIIYTDYLKTGAIISDLTPDTDVCYNLGSQDKKWNEIHANYLEVSGIKIKDASQFVLGSGTGGDAIVFPSDISVNGDISCVNLKVDGITIKDASKFTIGSGTSDTNGIEFMTNTTISGDLTITGNINSSYITNLLSGVNEINGYAENIVTDISRGNIFSKYSGTQLLSDFSNQDVGIAATEIVDYFIEVRNNKYFINDVQTPQLELKKNTTYNFNHIPGIISVIPGVEHGNNLYGVGLVYYFTNSSGHYIYIFDDNEYRTWSGLMRHGSFKYDPIAKQWGKYALDNPSSVTQSGNTVTYIVNGITKTFTDPYSTYYNDHPFRFYTDSAHTTLYNTSVTYDGSMITITTSGDDITLYYDCSLHSGMGSDAPIILKEKEDYKNFNIKVVNESSLLTHTINEYNQYNLGDSNVFRLVDSTDSFGISKTGIIVEKTDANYKIESDVCFNITNNNNIDLCLNVILTKNNVVLNSAFYNVNSNSVNNIQYNSLDRLNLLQNDVLNVKYLLYNKRYNAVTINDLSSLDYSNDSLLDFSYTSPVFTPDHGTNLDDPTNEHPFKDTNGNKYNWYGNLIVNGYDLIDPDDQDEFETDISKSHLDDKPNVNDYSNNDIFKNSNKIKLTDGVYGIDQYYTLSGEKLIVNTDIQLDTYINIEYRLENHQVTRANYISFADDDIVKLHQIVFVVKKSGDNETIIDYIKFMHSKKRIDDGTEADHTGESIINNYNIFSLPQLYNNTNNNPLYTQFGHPWTLPFRFNLKDYSLKFGDELTFKSILVFYYCNKDYPVDNAVSYIGLNRLHLDNSKGPSGGTGGYRLVYHPGTVEYSVNIEIPPQTNKVYTNEIDVNLRSFNLSVEKSLDPPPDFNYNITVMNNSVLNNQDIYSKYKATNLLTDFSNQNVGFNPDYNKTFTVVTVSYLNNANLVVIGAHNSDDSTDGTEVIDNNIDTRWFSKTKGPAYISFDLNQEKTVYGLKIVAGEKRFKEFTLEKSSDGTYYDTIQYFNEFNQNQDLNSDTNNTYNLYLDNKHTAQYFKLSNIYSGANTDGNGAGWVSISEIQFIVLDSESTTDVSYIINNELQPDLSLNVDTPYIFDLTNVSSSHPFNIYTQLGNNSDNLYTGAVIDGSFIYLTIDSATTTLYYNCSNHPGMGGLIDVINTSNYHNFNVKFIGDTNSIVRSDLTEYNRFNLSSSKFGSGSTSGYANSVDLSGIIVGVYGEYYNIDASLNLTVTNTSVYDISLDFVLLQNSVVLYSQTINVNPSPTSQEILINPQLSRLTMFENDTVNFAFLPYIKVFDDLNRSVNSPLTGLSYEQDPTWIKSVSSVYLENYKEYMMDSNPGTKWISSSSSDGSVTFEFDTLKSIVGLKITAPERRLTEFTLQKSNDGLEFNTIKHFSGFNPNPTSTYDTNITYRFNLSNIHNTQHIKLINITGNQHGNAGITELEFLFLDSTSDNYLTNINLEPIDLDIIVNNFNIEVSAPDYEELQVSNLLTANNIDVNNIDIQNTLTIASQTPTTGDSIVFDGNQLTWKNAILDVREYIKNPDITQRGSIITGKNNQGYKYFGGSVDISEDGSRIVIGTYPKYGNAYFGQVNVYEFSTNNNNWIQLGQTILFEPGVPYPNGGGNNAGQIGASVRINPTGDIIMFGATQEYFSYNTDARGSGYVEIYDLSYINNTDASWILRDTITPSQNDNDRWGHSVAMNYDATIVVISSERIIINNNNYTGQVKIYELSGNTNQYENTKTLTGNANDKLGASVALDNAGNVLVIGAPAYNRGSFGQAGAAYIYTRTEGANWYSDWTEQRHEEGRENDRLGGTVAISGNGEVIAIGQGGWPADNNRGSLRILEWDGIAWQLYDTTTGANNRNTSYDTEVTYSYFIPSQAGGSDQPNSQVGELGISLSYSGDKLAVCAHLWDYDGGTSNGAVQIFNWTGTKYEFVKILYGPDGSQFGSGIAISDNGKYMVVGAPLGESSKGLVYNYDLKSESINSGELYYNRSDYVLRIMP